MTFLSLFPGVLLWAAGSQQSTDALIHKRWVLATIYGVEAPKTDQEVYISFKEGGHIKGYAGCNSFTATYSSKKGGIRIDNISAGTKDCDRKMLEQQMISSLQHADDFYISGNELQLFEDGKMVASFQAVNQK